MISNVVRLFVILVLTVFVSSTLSYAQKLEKRISNLEAKINAQQKQLEEANKTIEKLEAELKSIESGLGTIGELNNYVKVETGTVEGLVGPHVIFEGVNVHIRNNKSTTTSIDGLGNLIIGHNEMGDEVGVFYPTPQRSGSHNLVVGSGHTFTNVGGLVAGFRNSINGSFSSITGGFLNVVDGEFSSVSGGLLNNANGEFSSILGGMQNQSSNLASSVSGGSYSNVNQDRPLVSEESDEQPKLESNLVSDETNEQAEENESANPTIAEKIGVDVEAQDVDNSKYSSVLNGIRNLDNILEVEKKDPQN